MKKPFIIVGTPFVALLTYGFLAAGGSIIESLAISIWIYGIVSLFYAMRLVLVKARGIGYVATDHSEGGDLDFSTHIAWLDSSISKIFSPILIK